MSKSYSNHSSVNYIEPNDVNLMEVRDSNGVMHYIERAPKLEDFCIALGLEVELSNRSVDIEISESDRKLTMIYSGTEGGNRVSFYKGTVFGSNGSSYLTTYYADMTSEDIKSYTTTEMIGIKSVDVEYDNFCVPQITIVFTDVRGMSLFQPSEINKLKKDGFAEISNVNVSNAFFRSFFMIPCPKFTIYLKGFYGEPVAYQMTCVDFRASFDSENGNFDVTVKFVGYTFSFLTEVSVNALIAAPYSDYIGADYWKKNIDNGRFTLPANKETNETRPMPTLCELVTDLYRVITESAIEIGNSDFGAGFRDNSAEIGELTEILGLYTNWYEAIFGALQRRYGDKHKAVKVDSAKFYDFGVFFVPADLQETITNLSIPFKEISGETSVMNAHIALRTRVNSYNSNANKQITLKNVSEDLSEFTRQKYVEKITYNGTGDASSASSSEFIVKLDSESVFSPEDINKYSNSSTLYNLTDSLLSVENYGYEHRDTTTDNTSVDVIKVDLECEKISNRIKALSTTYTQSEAEEVTATMAKLQRTMILKKLSWYPSIENFTKIMMAHLETLMYMMFKTIEATKGRTPQALGVTIGGNGEGINCSDVPADYSTVPPFPRVTSTKIERGQGGDSVEVKEDVWIGDVGKASPFIEVDLVNGLLNGADEVNAKIKAAHDAYNELMRSINRPDDGLTCVVPFPLTSFDYYLTENPYGTNSDVVNSFAAFAGKVALRMYGILVLNRYATDFTSSDNNFLSDENIKCVGSVEADNFYELNRMSNAKLNEALTNKSFTSQNIIDIVENKASASSYKEGSWPWSHNEALFKDDANFHPTFEGANGALYPLQGFDFSAIEENLAIYSQRKLNLTDNKNIVSPFEPADNTTDILAYALADSSSHLNYSIEIDDNLGIVNTFLANGAANTKNEDYQKLATNIFNKISSEGIDGDTLGQTFKGFFKNNGMGSFCGVHGTGATDSLSHDRKKRVALADSGMTALYDPDSGSGDPNDKDNPVLRYVHEELSLSQYTASEKTTNQINSVFLTEVFGCLKSSGSFISKNSSYFISTTQDSLYVSDAMYEVPDWDETFFPKKYVEAVYFVLGLYGVDYGKIDKYITSRTHFYIPRFVSLQIGAILAAEYYTFNKEFKRSYAASELCKLIPLMEDLKNNTDFLKHIAQFSKTAKLEFIRNFKRWVDSDGIVECFQKFKMYRRKFGEEARIEGINNGTDGQNEYGINNAYNLVHAKNYSNGDNQKSFQSRVGNYWFMPQDDVYRAIFVSNNINYSVSNTCARLLFNEKNQYVRRMSNSLLQVVCVTKGHIFSNMKNSNAFNDINSSDYYYTSLVTKLTPSLDINKAKIYLDSFLNRLSDRINGITGGEASADNPSSLVHMSLDPKQVTTDMKIALYLYLKQLYDKWMPSTSMDDWKFDRFFNNSDNNGHKFHFIDSFYNKIGQKLLINPEELVRMLEKSMLSPDWNATMLPFMSDIFADHKCMFKCVQNFIDLTSKDSMDNMFKPIPFNQMKEPERNPDFVVIYPYQPSSNLDMNNGQFEDDGFMLNDAEKSPMAIATRTLPSSENAEKEWYQLPAFGVVYGGQYQSYFKRIDINMDNPIATEQVLNAKYRIAEMYRTDSTKTVATTAQDLYDIYANRSYTCKIQMMGCAWVQPLMYFVLLNVPMFKGSYMIMKVSHKMTPGNMETEIVGCRMCRVSTRLVSDIFTDEGGGTIGSVVEDFKYSIADSDNDCPYQLFPIHNEFNGNVDASADEVQKGLQIMQALINADFTEITAAASVGCMYGESRLDHTKINKNDRGYISGSLCQWRAGNLKALCDGTPEKYWCYKYSEVPNTIASPTNAAFWGNKLKQMNINQCIKYYVDTFKVSNCYSRSIADFNSCTTISSAVDWWYRKYGVGAGAGDAVLPPSAHIDVREGFANKIYNEFRSGGHSHAAATPPKNQPQTDEKEFNELFYNAVSKTFNKCTNDGNMRPLKVKNITFRGNQVKAIQFEETSGKLYKIFDILLNGYCDYVQTIDWVYDTNNPGGDPTAIQVYAREKEEVEPNFRQVSVTDKDNANNNDVPDGTGDTVTFNLKFFKSIMKRYGGNPKPSKNTGDNLYKIVTNNGDYSAAVKKGLNKVGITDCNTLVGGLKTLSDSQFDGVATLKDINIGNVNSILKVILDIREGSQDNMAALDYIDSNKMRKCVSQGIIKSSRMKEINGIQMVRIENDYHGACTSGPTTWYNRAPGGGFVAISETGNKERFNSNRWWSYGGLNVHTSNHTATMKYFHALRPASGGTTGFKLVWHGDLTNCGNSSSPKEKRNTVWGGYGIPGFSIKPGDIATFHIKKANGESSSHGAMWTGHDWRSDAIQYAMSCYGSSAKGRDGDYSVCIWRHPDLQIEGEKDFEEVS